MAQRAARTTHPQAVKATHATAPNTAGSQAVLKAAQHSLPGGSWRRTSHSTRAAATKQPAPPWKFLSVNSEGREGRERPAAHAAFRKANSGLSRSCRGSCTSERQHISMRSSSDTPGAALWYARGACTKYRAASVSSFRGSTNAACAPRRAVSASVVFWMPVHDAGTPVLWAPVCHQTPAARSAMLVRASVVSPVTAMTPACQLFGHSMQTQRALHRGQSGIVAPPICQGPKLSQGLALLGIWSGSCTLGDGMTGIWRPLCAR